MGMPVKKYKKFRSLKVSDKAWYALKRISTEERCSICILVEQIILQYFSGYKRKKDNTGNKTNSLQ